MSTNCYKIPVPVAPHVKKYLQAMFGDAYYLNKQDSLGVFIITMLQKDSKVLSELSSPKSTELYELHIPTTIAGKQGVVLDPKAIKYIGEIIDKYFREQCYSYSIVSKNIHGSEYLTSIKQFCAFYDISPDHINYESLYRQFFRKKTDNSPNFVSNLCRIAGQ